MAVTKNLVKVTVSTGYDSSATSIVLQAGQGAQLPDVSTLGPVYLTWWDSTLYADPADDPNAEIISVTNISTDTLTVVRGRQDTSATSKNTGGSTYKMVLAPTALDFGHLTVTSSGSRTIYVDALNGSDTDGQRGNSFRPYQTLTAAWSQINSGDTVLIHGASTYYTVTPAITVVTGDTAPLKLTSKTGVSIIGIGKPVIYGAGSGDFITLTSCADTRIQGIEFLGDDTHGSASFYAGIFGFIQLRDVATYNRNTLISDCIFRNGRNHGVLTFHSDSLKITNCYFNRLGWIKTPSNGGSVDGASIAGMGRHVVISHNTFYDVLRGVEIEGAMNYDACNIQGNTFEKVWELAIMGFATSFDELEMMGATIVGNSFSNCHLAQAPYTIEVVGQGCISTDGGRQWVIANNNMYDCDRGIFVNAGRSHMTDVVIDANVIVTMANQGAQLYEYTTYSKTLKRVNFTNNIIQNISGLGLIVRGREITIAGNRIYDCNNIGIKMENGVGVLTTPNYFVIRDNRIGRSANNDMVNAIYIGSDYTDPVIYDNDLRTPTTPIVNNAQGGGSSVVLRDNQT